jgi:hypothetical protein
VNVVDGVADVLEDGLERHEEVAVLEAVLDPEKKFSLNFDTSN